MTIPNRARRDMERRDMERRERFIEQITLAVIAAIVAVFFFSGFIWYTIGKPANYTHEVTR